MRVQPAIAVAVVTLVTVAAGPVVAAGSPAYAAVPVHGSGVHVQPGTAERSPRWRTLHVDPVSEFPRSARRRAHTLVAQPRTAADMTPGPNGDQVRPARDPLCTGTGRDGDRVEVVYVHDEGFDRWRQAVPEIRNIVGAVDRLYDLSAQFRGVGRRVRWLTEAKAAGGCQVVVKDVTGPPATASGDGDAATALLAAGLNPKNRNRDYLVFEDGASSGLCGEASTWDDDRPGLDNRNATGGNSAWVWRNCWTWSVAAHELGHVLGAVQPSAPHATPGGHCLDGVDPMCYQDGTTTKPMTYPCAGTQRWTTSYLDCNHDTYYDPSPPAGSYLATHWDIARSPFLDASNGISQGAPTVTLTAGTGLNVYPNVPFTVSTTATTPAGRFTDSHLQEWWALGDTSCAMYPPTGDTVKVACGEPPSTAPNVDLWHDVVDVDDRTAEVHAQDTIITPSQALPATATLTVDQATVSPGTIVTASVAVLGQLPGQAAPTTPLANVSVDLALEAQMADGTWTITDRATPAVTGLDGTATVQVPIDRTTRLLAQFGAGAWQLADSYADVSVPSSTTVPDAPAIYAAYQQAGVGDATIRWVAPTPDGRPPITSYTVTAEPGGASTTVAGDVTTATVTGLTGGATYDLSVVATNANGESPPAHALHTVRAWELAPPAPLDVTTSAAGANALHVDWHTTPTFPYLRSIEVETNTGAIVEADTQFDDTEIAGLPNRSFYRARARQCSYVCGPWSPWSGVARGADGWGGAESFAVARSSSGHVLAHPQWLAGWRDLGGTAASTPVVVTNGTNHWYILENPHHTLWVRRDHTSWQRLAPSTTHCRQPAAITTGGSLYLVCRTGTGRVRAGSTPLTTKTMPFLGRMHALNGVSAYGPSVTDVAGRVTYLRVGANHYLYSRTQTSGWVRRSLRCAAAPGAGFLRWHRTWIGCAGLDGTVNLLSAGSHGWSTRTTPLAQQARGRIGVVVEQGGDVRIYLQTPNGQVWTRNLYSAFATYGAVAGGGVSSCEA